jgi:hypothetical protein
VTTSENTGAGRSATKQGGENLRTLVTLLPTPVAQPSGNTPENHLRKKPGREVVTDLAILVENDLIETGGKLLPTPAAMNPNDGESLESWEARRARVKLTAKNGNGFGKPLAIAALEISTGDHTPKLFVAGKPCEEPHLPLPN